jgi:glycosyltransferase involved in cell wall biosynthesis
MMSMHKLSVVLATFNEEKNIAACLESVKDIASEIIIVDGSSSDNTVAIAEKYGAKITVTDNPPIFHINKQKALEQATYAWVLQMDADERVSKALAEEIKQVIAMNDAELHDYQLHLKKRALFLRHQALIEKRDGKIGRSETEEYAAFFLPRKNYFLGRYLTYGGVYPDGVIRIVKKGKAHFPCKDVHEQIAVDGKVGWLEHDLYHIDSPTFRKYLLRWNRYTSLFAKEHSEKKTGFGPVAFLREMIVNPSVWFLMTYIRHKGILDSWQGFVFSFFSALRFPVSYLKYLRSSIR